MKQFSGIIYKSTNKITGKHYIGQTKVNLPNRKSQHKFHANNGCKFLFHTAIRKYGWDNFKWEILYDCVTPEDLNEKELNYIKEYNSLKPNGYNMSLNKHGFLGTSLSGKNNPRYGDHRTWEEIHGKEKADRMKEEKSALYKDKVFLKDMKRKVSESLKKNNPMHNPKHRETLSKIRMGGNNPTAIWEWKFILPDGTIYKTDCLRQFCRETGFSRAILTKIHKKDYHPRTPFYKEWKVVKTLKEKNVNETKETSTN